MRRKSGVNNVAAGLLSPQYSGDRIAPLFPLRSGRSNHELTIHQLPCHLAWNRQLPLGSPAGSEGKRRNRVNLVENRVGR
jgi:hypothetical protein